MTSHILTRIGLLGVLALAGASAHAAPTQPTSSAARFAALKRLAGDWVERRPDGKPGDTVATSIRVTAAGSLLKSHGWNVVPVPLE